MSLIPSLPPVIWGLFLGFGMLAERISKLKQGSLDKQQADFEEAKQKRKEQWEAIQAVPELAEFLREVNSVFGKPKRTWVVINGERIL